LGSPAGQANNRNRCFSIARRQKSTGRIQRARSHSIGKIKINGVGYAAANKRLDTHVEIAVVRSQYPVAWTETTTTTLWTK
jgi:hypothetical protein